ncbi:MAG TPA: FHA domain-containing protein [Myxococcota bacterium]|jgi:hypothetical protein|nr:FHA domain-containing protein [Myxococcota bacterium]
MAGEPRFFLTTREKEYALGEGEHVVGRTTASDLHMPSDQVSRKHARVIVGAEFLEVEDLGSLNGTFVNGERLVARQVLLPGDRVRFGDRELLVRAALSALEHEIRTPITSGYAKLPELHQPTVIVTALTDDEPTLPSSDPRRADGVLVALRDDALAEELVRAALAGGSELPFRAVSLHDLYAELGQAGRGALVLDVDALGPALPDLLKAWRGPGREADPVVVVGGLGVREGDDVARRLGVDAFVPALGPRADVAAAILAALQASRDAG